MGVLEIPILIVIFSEVENISRSIARREFPKFIALVSICIGELSKTWFISSFRVTVVQSVGTRRRNVSVLGGGGWGCSGYIISNKPFS